QSPVGALCTGNCETMPTHRQQRKSRVAPGTAFDFHERRRSGEKLMEYLTEKVRNFINAMNERGIPLPMLRINGKATFTGTMTFIAFNTALLGQIGKVTKVIGEVDLTQANYLFLICLGAYL